MPVTNIVVGFVGLGTMGGRMAANLQKAGYRLVVHDLHRQAGTASLAEIHGNYRLIRCLECNLRFSEEKISLEVLPPPCPECGGLLKSDTVSFGEPIPGVYRER